MVNSTARKRVFIAFAIEDEGQRTLLVGQGRLEKSPFDFIDMSLNEPYDEKWKTQCRSRIKGCDGTIALISKNTAKSDGEKWEIACSIEEGKKTRGLYAYSNDRSAKPAELGNNTVMEWTWANIKAFIDSLP
jgi:hypothetical protein